MSRRSKKKHSERQARPLLFLCKLFLAASFLIALAPLLPNVLWLPELLSHFPLQCAALALLLAFFCLHAHRNMWSVLLLLMALFHGARLLPLFDKAEVPLAATESPETVTVLQYNIYRDNSDPDEMASWLVSKADEADVIILFEVTDHFDAVLPLIQSVYPFAFRGELRGTHDVLVLSRLPESSAELMVLSSEHHLTRVLLHARTPITEQPITFYITHPPTAAAPWLAMRRNQVLLSTADVIHSDPVPLKIWAGDFNTTRFSPVFTQLLARSGLQNTAEGFGFMSTWPSVLGDCCGIMIDQMLVSSNLHTLRKVTGPAMGSDHFPVITTLSIPSL